MNIIFKCNKKESLIKYIDGLNMSTFLYYRDEERKPEEIHKDMFPCLLMVDIQYPYCGPDTAEITIIKELYDMDLLAVDLNI